MAVCKTCGAIVSPGDAFCPVCGQGLFSAEDAFYCAACGTANPPGTRFCKKCGAVLLKKPKTIQCPVCGSENAEDALYCTTCGSEMPGTVREEFEPENLKKLREVLPDLMSYAATFDDEFAQLSEEELKETTYVCPVCGKRNNISDEKCRRCGRSRARSEELARKGRIPSFENAVEIPDKPHTMPPVEGEIIPAGGTHDFLRGRPSAGSTFGAPAGGAGMNAGGGYAGGGFVRAGGYQQAPPVVQPLAIVPYLTQEQPLWQFASREDYDRYMRQNNLNPGEK